MERLGEESKRSLRHRGRFRLSRYMRRPTTGKLVVRKGGGERENMNGKTRTETKPPPRRKFQLLQISWNRSNGEGGGGEALEGRRKLAGGRGRKKGRELPRSAMETSLDTFTPDSGIEERRVRRREKGEPQGREGKKPRERTNKENRGGVQIPSSLGLPYTSSQEKGTEPTS